MIVVTTGSRHWTDEETIYRRLWDLKQLNPDLLICHGASRGGGADKFVAEACHDLKIDQKPYPVIGVLDGYYRGAPLNRNSRMLEDAKPDLVLAFRAAGKSNGTDDTLHKAGMLQIPTETVYEQATCNYSLS